MMSPIEIIAVFTAILYLVWLFVKISFVGRHGSSVPVFIFLLCSRRISIWNRCFRFYIVMGLYGWLQWKKRFRGVFEVNTMSINDHVKIVSIILFLSVLFGSILGQFTDAALPFGIL